MDQRLSLITLGVSDVERAQAFYQALGWKVDGGGWGGVTLAYNLRSPEEVDGVLEEAKAAGGAVPRAGAETSWGGYSGLFIDPDGHPWEVAHNPGWKVHEDGSTTME